MKVYIKEEFYCKSRKDDFSRIMAHLTSNGNLIVAPRTIDMLYRAYSEEKYRMNWKPVDDDVLERFADWLSVTEF